MAALIWLPVSLFTVLASLVDWNLTAPKESIQVKHSSTVFVDGKIRFSKRSVAVPVYASHSISFSLSCSALAFDMLSQRWWWCRSFNAWMFLATFAVLFLYSSRFFSSSSASSHPTGLANMMCVVLFFGVRALFPATCNTTATEWRDVCALFDFGTFWSLKPNVRNVLSTTFYDTFNKCREDFSSLPR